jgi:26S proteasome subunit RPN6 C-terminal helix domain
MCPFQNTYGAVIDTLEQVGKVADSLYAKVRAV